jgi:hypothetical protein
VGLGNFKDDPVRLYAAISWLSRHRQPATSQSPINMAKVALARFGLESNHPIAPESCAVAALIISHDNASSEAKPDHEHCSDG